jgi:colicin import membrane protein
MKGVDDAYRAKLETLQQQRDREKEEQYATFLRAAEQARLNRVARDVEVSKLQTERAQEHREIGHAARLRRIVAEGAKTGEQKAELERLNKIVPEEAAARRATAAKVSAAEKLRARVRAAAKEESEPRERAEAAAKAAAEAAAAKAREAVKEKALAESRAKVGPFYKYASGRAAGKYGIYNP